MKPISKPCLIVFRAAAAVLLLAGQPAQAAGGKPEKFNPADWKDWKVLSSSRQFDGAQGAAFDEMFLGALAKGRQEMHIKGDASDFGTKQIVAAAQVNKDYAAEVQARPHFRVWLDAVESGKFNDLVRSGEWTASVGSPPFPVIYNSFDLPGGRKLGVAVLQSYSYETPDSNPANKLGVNTRCSAGNGVGASNEIAECPAKAYLVEPDGRISQSVDFYACFVEFGNNFGGAPERDSISAAFDARRGQVAILTTVGGAQGRRPIMTGGPDECGPIVVSVPFAKE